MVKIPKAVVCAVLSERQFMHTIICRPITEEYSWTPLGQPFRPRQINYMTSKN